MRGKLIAFEGIDGAGKSSQARALAQALESAGFSVLLSREPTDGPWGRKLRQSALHQRLSPEEELEAFLADRRQHVEELIAPGLAAGKIILVDRYYFSTVAYQGIRGLNPQQLLEENESFAPAPDLLILLELEAAEGLRRIHGRGDVSDLFEREQDLREVAKIFAGMHFSYALRLDAMRAPEQLEAEILARVMALLQS